MKMILGSSYRNGIGGPSSAPCLHPMYNYPRLPQLITRDALLHHSNSRDAPLAPESLENFLLSDVSCKS